MEAAHYLLLHDVDHDDDCATDFGGGPCVWSCLGVVVRAMFGVGWRLKTLVDVWKMFSKRHHVSATFDTDDIVVNRSDQDSSHTVHWVRTISNNVVFVFLPVVFYTENNATANNPFRIKVSHQHCFNLPVVSYRERTTIAKRHVTHTFLEH